MNNKVSWTHINRGSKVKSLIFYPRVYYNNSFVAFFSFLLDFTRLAAMCLFLANIYWRFTLLIYSSIAILLYDIIILIAMWNLGRRDPPVTYPGELHIVYLMFY